ncbi:dockerin type 1 [Colletotrichum higginsianum]|nr:dockerin type 1 [Colletotrichum higginsianum]
MSVQGVATNPAVHQWTPSLFSPTHNQLPGYTRTGQLGIEKLFLETTYPADGRRVRAGAGSDHLFRYSSKTQSYSYVGQFLTGVKNNPYINGISYAGGRIHVSGTYRGFVWYEGVDDPEARLHTLGETVFPDGEDLIVFDIPMNSGILNQEAQAADGDGGFHVLNRENEVWMHYYRSPEAGEWSRHALPDDLRPTRTGARGDVVAVPGGGGVVFALPGNRDDTLTVLGARLPRKKKDGGGGGGDEAEGGGLGFEYVTLWRGDGFSGEPQIEAYESGAQQMVSIYTRTEGQKRQVVVLDFVLDGSL